MYNEPLISLSNPAFREMEPCTAICYIWQCVWTPLSKPDAITSFAIVFSFCNNGISGFEPRMELYHMHASHPQRCSNVIQKDNSACSVELFWNELVQQRWQDFGSVKNDQAVKLLHFAITTLLRLVNQHPLELRLSQTD